MREQQPAFCQLDRRSAIADLDELPGKLRLQDRLTAFPSVQIVRIDQIKILVVLPRNHGVLAVDPARKQRHTLVACRRTMQRRHSKREEVAGLDQLRSNRSAPVSGIGRVVGGPAAIAELDKTGVFYAVRLG